MPHRFLVSALQVALAVVVHLRVRRHLHLHNQGSSVATVAHDNCRMVSGARTLVFAVTKRHLASIVLLKKLAQRTTRQHLSFMASAQL